MEKIPLSPEALKYGEDNWGFCLACGAQQYVSSQYPDKCIFCGEPHVNSITEIKLKEQRFLQSEERKER